MKIASTSKNVGDGITRPSKGPRGVKGRSIGTITVARALNMSSLLGWLR